MKTWMKNRFVVEVDLATPNLPGWSVECHCDLQGDACLIAHLLYQHFDGKHTYRVTDRKTRLVVWQRERAVAPVSCQCCNKAVARWRIKDNGFKTWAGCDACLAGCPLLLSAERLEE